jgi:adenine/guanine phosphoribosyltransferase-like PRPP-binding protein
LQQLQGAFVAGPQAKALTQALHHGATVLLLDDLVTTGGTLQACTQALEALAQEAGALLPLQRFCLGFVPQ